MVVVGIVNIIIAATASDPPFFRSYYDDTEHCVISPYCSILTTVFTIALFIALVSQSGLCFKGDDLTKPRLNVIHRRRNRRLPLFVIPFILIGVLSIVGNYVSDPWPTIIGYIACVICVAVMTIYLYYFIIAPLRESMQVRLLRGNLTQRHGAYLDEPLTSSPSVSQDLGRIVSP
jgi:peptidoglycan/LPS O-acetylase OafA/YrhL